MKNYQVMKESACLPASEMLIFSKPLDFQKYDLKSLDKAKKPTKKLQQFLTHGCILAGTAKSRVPKAELSQKPVCRVSMLT